MKKIRFIICCFLFHNCFHAYTQIWSAVGIGIGEPSGGVMSFKVINGKLYVGGGLLTAGGKSTYGIAIWDGINWDSLGSGLDGSVFSVEEYNDEIYAGGNFWGVPNIWPPPFKYVSKWDGSNWNKVGNKIPSSQVRSLHQYKNELYVGGYFYSLDDSSGNQTVMNRIARWNGNSWNSVTGGVTGGGPPSVTAMAVFNDELYVGGTFNWAGTQEAFYIARWNGTQWNKVGDYGVNGSVLVLKSDTVNNILFVAGPITLVDTIPAKWLGQWDGQKWSPVAGTEIIPNDIYALEIYNGYLYAGIPNLPVDTNFLRWDGKQWEILNGPSSSILALTVYQDELYVGGTFQSVNGDTSMRYLARWHAPNYCDSIHSTFAISTDTVYLSDSAAVQTTPSGFANQYEWDFASIGSAPDTAQFPTHYYDSAGVYNIKLKATFGFCPWDSAEKTVVVVNDVGIKELAEGSSQLKIYPNPAGGSFTVEIQSENLKFQNARLEIYDVKGKMVYQSQIQNLKTEIQTLEWKKGSYFMNIISEGKIVAKEKVVIK